MLAVGVFAWALKKKSGGTKFLLIETVDDAHLFELKAKHYREARSFAAKAMAAVRKGQDATAEKAAHKAEEAEATAIENGPQRASREGYVIARARVLTQGTPVLGASRLVQ